MSYVEALYCFSHRVRKEVFRCLKEKYRSCSGDVKNIIRQHLFLCYTIGFGTRRSEEERQSLRQEALPSSLDEWLLRVIPNLGRQDARTPWQDWSRFSEEITQNSSLESLGWADQWLTTDDFEHLQNELKDVQEAARSLDQLEKPPEAKSFVFIECALLEEISSYLTSTGHLSEAETYQLRLVDLLREASPSRPDWRAQCEWQLASIYAGQYRFADFLNLQERAMKEMERYFGPHSQRLLSHKTRLAGILMGYGLQERAFGLLQDCRNSLAFHYGKNHPQTLLSEKGLLENYTARENLAEVERLGPELICRCERAFGQEHFLVARVQSILGSAKTGLAKLSEAEDLLSKALAMTRRLVEQNQGQAQVQEQCQLCDPLIRLANLYLAQGKFQLARFQLTEAMLIAEKTLGMDHSFYILAKVLFAKTFLEQPPGEGRLLAAEILLREGFRDTKSMMGEKHPVTLEYMSYYAKALEKLDRQEAAEVSLKCQHLKDELRVANERQSQIAVSAHLERLLFLYSI